MLCGGVLLGFASNAEAQNATSPREAPSAPLLTSKQGKQIAETALLQDEPIAKGQDCSHLVHQIYLAAGYQYPYASSFELYAGHGNFRRVRHAQAGDLIAWRGHVGIVISAKQHTFYSLVRSGLQTEDYLSPYWRSRGTPRFFRYALDSGAPATSTIRASSGPASAKPTVSTIAETEKISHRPKRQSPTDEDEPSRDRVGEPSNAGEPGEEAPVTSVEILSQRDRPSTAEILAAVNSFAENSARAFRIDKPLRVATPVLISDEIKLEKLELKRDKGWAHLRIVSLARITADGANFNQRQEKAKWELRRGEDGWSATVPQDYKVVSRDAAVRVLASQLAQLAQSDRAAQHDQTVIGEEARIANVIAALLEK
jgi:hypothetical protein